MPETLVWDPKTRPLPKEIDLVGGDDRDITRTIIELPSSQTLDKAWMTVKVRKGDDDTDAVFQKTITPSFVAGEGQITDTGADGTGALLFELTKVDTAELNIGREYPYDIQARLDPSGKARTLEIGVVTASQGLTGAVA